MCRFENNLDRIYLVTARFSLTIKYADGHSVDFQGSSLLKLTIILITYLGLNSPTLPLISPGRNHLSEKSWLGGDKRSARLNIFRGVVLLTGLFTSPALLLESVFTKIGLGQVHELPRKEYFFFSECNIREYFLRHSNIF